MRLRPHRRILIPGRPRGLAPGSYPGPARTRPRWIRRARRRLGIGALLAVIGARRLARAMRARWEPLCLLAGALLTAGGYFLPVIGLFFPGLLVLTITLLKGNSDQCRGPRPARPAGPRAAEPPRSTSYRAAAHGRTGPPATRRGQDHPPR